MVTKVRSVVIHMRGDQEVATGEMTVIGDGEPEEIYQAIDLAEDIAMDCAGAVPVGVPNSRKMRIVIEEDRPDFLGTLMDVQLLGDGTLEHKRILRQVVIRTSVRRMPDIVRVVSDLSIYDQPDPEFKELHQRPLRRPAFHAVMPGRQGPDPEVTPA